MSDTLFKSLLNSWDQEGKARNDLVTCPIQLSQDDAIKIDALAEVYQLPRAELLASLLHTALLQVEEQIPYVAGNKIIRMEEGEPVYEDIGRMPEYMAARQRLSEVLAAR